MTLPTHGLEIIGQIREFDRFYVKNTVMFDQQFLNGDLSLLAIRLLFEISHNKNITASELAMELAVDQGYLSRIVKSLEEKELITRQPDANDGRRKTLALSASGHKKMNTLNQFADEYIHSWISKLDTAQKQLLIESMQQIRAVMSQTAHEISYRDMQIGDLGLIVQKHGVLFSREFGWDETFELEAADVFTAFLRKRKPLFERAWIAEIQQQFSGCVFVMQKDTDTAQLRGLLVDPKYRGYQVGQKLVEQCILFSKDAGYKKLVLWTCDHLQNARRIYKKLGFEIIAQQQEHRWGCDMQGEHWELTFH